MGYDASCHPGISAARVEAMIHPVPFALRLLLVAVCLVCTLLVAHETLPRQSTSAEVARRPPAFAETYSYVDGLEVEVTDTWIGRQMASPVAELTVVVRNGSGHTFDAWLIGDLRYGPQRRSALRCSIAPPYGDPGTVQLIAIGGTSYPYRLCFVLPPASRHDVVFEIQIDAGVHEAAVFAGGL
jgi:hypothetical protein